MTKEYKVEKSVVNGVVYYSYRGIFVSRADWASAACAIYCDEISNKDMEEIPQRLYNILVNVFGECAVQNYIEKGMDYKRFDEIDEIRCREEENLFLDYGGRYYEDMTDEEYDNLPKETLEDEMNEYIEDETKRVLSNVFTETSYMNMVYDIIIDDVKTDVKECADEEFNDSDISLAVQRSLLKALNVEV